MRASEFLRKLTDFIDSVEQLTDDSEDSPDTPSQAVMVPPLQQNIELLKKASGVQSIYQVRLFEDLRLHHLVHGPFAMDTNLRQMRVSYQWLLGALT